MIDLGADLHGLLLGAGGDGGDHELLEVEAVRGVRATVDDVEVRDGQGGGRPGVIGDPPVQGQAGARGEGAGGRDGDGDDGVRSEAGEVRGSIQCSQRFVDLAKRSPGVIEQEGADLAVDGRDSGADSASAERGAAVAQLDRFERARRGARGGGGVQDGVVVQTQGDSDGREAAGVEDLPCGDVGDDQRVSGGVGDVLARPVDAGAGVADVGVHQVPPSWASVIAARSALAGSR